MKKVFYSLVVFFFTASVALAQSPFGGPPQNPADPGDPTNPGSYLSPGDSATLNNPTDPGSVASVGNTATLDNPTSPGAVADVGLGVDAGAALGAGNGTQVGGGLLPTSKNAGTGIGVGRPTDPGYVLYGGNGGQGYSFWDYLKELFSLKGQDNQSTYKNQETVDQKTQTVKYTELTTSSEQPKTLSVQGSSSKTFLCKTDTSNKSLSGYINLATCVLVYLIPIMISAMVLWFMFGAVKVLNDNEHETRNQYKQFLTWGVFIIFIALCFVGILRLLSTTLGL